MHSTTHVIYHMTGRSRQTASEPQIITEHNASTVTGKTTSSQTSAAAAPNQLTTRNPPIMNSFRFARTALRATPLAARVPLQRRAYAEAVSDKVRQAPGIGCPETLNFFLGLTR